MERKILIAGNWKMNLDLGEAVSLAKGIASAKFNHSPDVMIAPSFTNIYAVSSALTELNSKVMVGAQNLYFEDSGAFTGEISASMIKSAGADWVILGHSERRHVFHENDDDINKKIIKALSENIKVILCVGELLSDREKGKEVETVLAQVERGLCGVESLADVVIAYEPVWAIGSGKPASVNDAESMHNNIRKYIETIYGVTASNEIRILYGGSVKPDNIRDFMLLPNVDGALVGGASLKLDQFIKIINY